MLSNLPLLHEDETLYSWCGSAHAWMCSNSSTTTSRELFGAPYAALCHDFPSHLDYFVAETLQSDLDPTHLALSHSLLGYYLVSKSERTANEILAKVRESSLPSMKMRLGITASQVGGQHPLKACPKCVAENVETTGKARWLVRHQYPSVQVCLQHDQPLFVAWDPVSPVHRRLWLNPTDSSKWQRIDIPISDDKQFDKLVRLARFSEAWSSCGPASLDPERLASAYRSGLCQQGMATVSGSLRLRALIAEAQRKYRCIEDLPGFEALRSITPDWPGLVASLSRKKPRNGHPLKHLLVIALIFDTWNDFLRELKSIDQLANEPEPQEENSEQPISEQLRKLMLEEGMSASAAAEVLGISKQVAIGLASREKMPLKRKPKKLRGALLREVIGFIQKGLPKKQIAEQTGVSRITVNRLIQGDPDLEQVWRTSQYLVQQKRMRGAFLATIAIHPSAAINEIRSVPDNGYMWLYRHDRDWLKENLPSLWSNNSRNPLTTRPQT